MTAKIVLFGLTILLSIVKLGEKFVKIVLKI
jgi:hypothetical protein